MWGTIAPQLESIGVLTRIDGNTLSRYCHLWVQWREADRFIRENGHAYPLKDEEGNVKYLQQYPQVAIAHKLCQQLLRLEQEFGMTPAARTRIQVDSKCKAADEFDEFLDGRDPA